MFTVFSKQVTTHQPSEPLPLCLTESGPTPYCLPWPSSTIPYWLLCTSPFSPSVCESQPPSLDIHPTPLRPQTAPTVRKKKERTEQFQTRRHKYHYSSSLFPPCPPDGLQHFYTFSAPMPETTQKRRIFSSWAWEGLPNHPQSNITEWATSMSPGYICSSRSCWLEN